MLSGDVLGAAVGVTSYLAFGVEVWIIGFGILAALYFVNQHWKSFPLPLRARLLIMWLPFGYGVVTLGAVALPSLRP